MQIFNFHFLLGEKKKSTLAGKENIIFVSSGSSSLYKATKIHSSAWSWIV